eukprot:2139859-Prymnesium_polylepis.2
MFGPIRSSDDSSLAQSGIRFATRRGMPPPHHLVGERDDGAIEVDEASQQRLAARGRLQCGASRHPHTITHGTTLLSDPTQRYWNGTADVCGAKG